MYDGKTMALRLFVAIYLSLFSLMTSANGIKEIYFTVTFHPGDLDRGSLDSVFHDYAILKLPSTYTETGKPTRLVYMAHGAGGGVSENEWFLNRFELQKLLLENGYAVFDVNGGRIENMGGELAVASAYNAWKIIVENYNVYPQIFVGGFSMGGLTSTNFVLRHSSLVLAHVMYSPVLDLYEQAWKNPWLKSTRQAIAEVYHFSSSTEAEYDFKATRLWNPINQHSLNKNGESIKIYPVPVKIWHGVGDPVVTVESSRRFCQEINLGGGSAELVEIDSDDHGLSCGNPTMNGELLAFLQRINQALPR